MKFTSKKSNRVKPAELLTIAAMLFILSFTTSCKDNGEPPKSPIEINPCDTFDYSGIDFSNIDNLWNQPLCVIKKCVEGK
jgi:hypothetical protein